MLKYYYILYILNSFLTIPYKQFSKYLFISTFLFLITTRNLAEYYSRAYIKLRYTDMIVSNLQLTTLPKVQNYITIVNFNKI